ncbi:MAG: tetratricopeptide repeat protein [Rhodospirillales bacterium]|nr:MAG: tetratricopeptide repeat protein [Rhodospirillales bacterium]
MAAPTPSVLSPIPGGIDPDLRDGMEFLRAGQIADAEIRFRTAMGRLGERPEILHFLAVCAFQKDDAAGAEKLWRRAVKRDPDEAMLHFNVGAAQHRQGKIDEAIRTWRQTLRLRPDYHEARLRLAGVCADREDFAAAETEFRALIAALDRPEATEGLSPEAVKQMWQRRAMAQAGLGYALFRLDRAAEALAPFDAALAAIDATSPEWPGIQGDRGLALASAGRLDDALAAIDEALAAAPGNARLHHSRGHVLHHAGRLEESEPSFLKAIELDPASADSARLLGLGREARGDVAGAMEAYETALKGRPDFATAIYDLSSVALEAKLYGRALDALKPWLDVHRDDAKAWNNAGLAFLGLNENERALQAFKRANRIDPADPLILNNYGRALLAVGRATEAAPLHRKALEKLPGDARLLAYYGECLLALGRLDAAVSMFTAAVSANPDLPLAHEGLDRARARIGAAPDS